jgi:hypothetical protein
MRDSSFKIAVLIFATTVGVACNGLELHMISNPSFVATGVLIGVVSLLYFGRFVALGGFFRFSVEYWLVGSVCYLLTTFLVSGLDLHRQALLFSPGAWTSLASTFILKRALSLAELGFGILVVAFFGNRYCTGRR